MKIGVIGATGKIGKCMFREALSRGHDVTAIIRNRAKVATPDLQLIVKDVFELTVEDIAQFDVVISAVGFEQSRTEEYVRLGHHYINIFQEVPHVRIVF